MMKSTKTKPVVLIPADVKHQGEHPFHMVGQKYILAVAEAAEATPLLVPAISEHTDFNALLEFADGIFLTGAVSNVHPSHFDQEVHNPELPLDPERDAITLNLIRAAIVAGVPLFGICRGFQEINVAFGGSLHQAVHEVVGMADHREPKDLPIAEQYAPAHSVRLVAGGRLANITGREEIMVNSLHGQGVDQLGNGLVAEAYAPDGLIEAIRVENAPTFALAVQWHPEWQVMQNPVYLSIFKAFGDACRARAAGQLKARGRAAPD
ncbi:gamma-glutamyl-gamma-aminobutyrate hydrolase family protein [Methylovorus sp. MM2]|uniref:gamma-glutamyl-gamma-aminobutyrate hydrolase family protein n=1 Tax=Methylovorus sp. MM2 TaxID=1848038 RepID=UPI000A740702|nr:gamma-glutamyl-gamma-aminobutyrate hydrolase family protein [Methylovorus sp. MM2]